MNNLVLWIFSHYDFSIKDIVEIADYEIVIDEETNGNSNIEILKNTSVVANDIIAVKNGTEIVYWGIVDNVSNEDGETKYLLTCKYITNMFDQKIELENESIISTTGVEDFIADAITNNFISNSDTFVNLPYLVLDVQSHNTKQVSVSNVENGIYNLHTWLTNCTQNYDIVYTFSVENKKLKMTIKKETRSTQLIDTNAQNISEYSEVFETDIVSKVIVLTSGNTYTLYLLNDRTTTTDGTNPNRAEGKTEMIYTENYSDANQEALNVIKGNSYNHNITFDFDKFIQIGTPIAIKTKESLIFNTYISSINIRPNKFITYQCGNIRINFIEKILKERKENA